MKKSSISPINTLLHVDREIKPTYPTYLGKVFLPFRPDLELTGPTYLDLTKVKLWRHQQQRYGCSMSGMALYLCLRRRGMLKNCLNLRDGEEIRKNGIKAFHKLFGSSDLYLWKSVAHHPLGEEWLTVPYVSVDDGNISIKWFGMGSRWRKEWQHLLPASEYYLRSAVGLLST